MCPFLLRREVAHDGVIRIPKSVFEADPPAVASSTSDVVATVRRLDGTVEEVKRVAPDNPNFQPRKPTPGKVRAINKEEVCSTFSCDAHHLGSVYHVALLLNLLASCMQALIAFHKRKGLPLPPELQSKADDMARFEKEEAQRVAERAVRFGIPDKSKVAKAGASDKAMRGGGPAAAASSELSEQDKAKLAARAARFNTGGASAASSNPTQPKPERPKGGVKVLTGIEGALKGEKRPAEGTADQRQAKTQQKPA